MQQFNVHSYIPVRVKITGVEAADHRAAIKAVEDDGTLQRVIADLIAHDREGDQIEAIEVDEGALAVGYLVDVQGDEDFGNSVSFDVNQKTGDLTAIGEEPGAGVTVSHLHRAILSAIDENIAAPALRTAYDQNKLVTAIDRAGPSSLVHLVAQQMAGLTAKDHDQVSAILDGMVAALFRAKNAIRRHSKADIHQNVLAFQSPENPNIVPVVIDGQFVGEIVRPTAGDGKYGRWQDARFCVGGVVMAYGMDKIMAYFRESYDVALQLEIEFKPGYTVFYGPDGKPKARILSDDDSGHEVRVFDGDRRATFEALPHAVMAARYASPSAQ